MKIFRLAKENDYKIISEMKNEIHSIHSTAEPKFYKSSNEVLLFENFKKEIEKQHIWILEEEDIIYGYVFIIEMNINDNPLIHNQKILFIDDFYISPQYRSKGLGEELFNKVEEFAKENDFTSIELNVWSFNDGARHFYESMGMRPTRIRLMKDI